MMAAGIAGVLLREIPSHLLPGVLDGSLKVWGSVVRNAGTGQIAGFLQEAGPLAKFIVENAPIPGIGMALDAAVVATNVAGLVQGEFIRAGVNRIEKVVTEIEKGMEALNALGVANLGLGAAGIGVAVVGFSMVSAKIDGIRRDVAAIDHKLDHLGDKVDQLSRDLVDVDFVELTAIAKSYDEAWRLSASAAEARWNEVARAALSFQGRFEMRAERLLQSGVSRYSLADPFLDAVSLTGSLRVAALAACNETVAAEAAAADGARALERLTGGIGMADLSRVARLDLRPEPGTPQWAHASAKANLAAGQTARKIRQREADAATRGAPFAELSARGVSSRDWLEAAREEKELPFLFLEASPA